MAMAPSVRVRLCAGQRREGSPGTSTIEWEEEWVCVGGGADEVEGLCLGHRNLGLWAIMIIVKCFAS